MGARVLVFTPKRLTFVEADIEALAKRFDVDVMTFPANCGRLDELLRFGIRFLSRMLGCDLVFSWFADYSYWPVKAARFLGKKSVVVVGGYDVAAVPEIEYGALLDARKASRVCYVLERADRVLVVDPELKDDAVRLLGVDGSNFEYVPTGYDPSRFFPLGEKEDIVLTVASASELSRARVKGVDAFIDAARLMAPYKFVMVGLSGQALEFFSSQAPKNVEFIAPLNQAELLKYYQRAKVYCQLSIREGLPNALCEAMLCECVPVGTNVQGVRTAMNGIGYLVPRGDPASASAAIKAALDSTDGPKARKSMKDRFPLTKREAQLWGLVDELVRTT